MRTGVRLGVDVGTVRVGLAASDPSGIMATPIRTLARAESTNKDVVAVAEAADEAQALEVVV
ncbi:Holliday junction resolvase RuvX, partial [Xanthomonas citri pv. citri]|nr:Holliday junction resolvase RuvX [Xanthomonas citri pv. citri]